MIRRLINFFCKKSDKSNQINTEKDCKKQEDEEYIPTQFEMWRFYRKFLKFDYKQIIFKNISTLLSTIAYAKQPFLLVRIKNALIQNDFVDLQSAFIGYLLCILLRQILNFVESQISQNSFKKMKQDTIKQILNHLFSLDMQYFEENKVTQISAIIKQGASQICSELRYSKIFDKIDSYIYYLGQIYFVYTVSPLILVSMFIFSFTSNLLMAYFKIKSSQIKKQESEESEFKDFALDDILNNMLVIKTFGTEKREVENLSKIIKQNKINAQRRQKYDKITDIIDNSAYEIAKIVIILQIFFWSGLKENQAIFANTLSEIIGYSYCTFLITNDILKLFQSQPADYYESRKKYIGKVMKLFETVPKIKQDYENNKNDTNLFEGNIAFDNVSFSYPVSKDHLAQMNQQRRLEEKEKKQQLNSNENSQLQVQEQTVQEIAEENINPTGNELNKQEEEEENMINKQPNKQIDQVVIKNMSFQIKKGQFVAFVGTSGSGKSTIIKLIQRFYDVNSGSILLDGQNIKDVSLHKLRRSIGLVSQEPSLFDNDIEYNITYGCENNKYTQEELKYICDISGVSEFVFDEKRFPEGLKTLVGSKGTKLSGGQKQRIAIARALIKKPKILILDEATSSLDAESENTVQQYIDQLVGYRGMTIVVVAHRLSTIVKSDNIFVMEKGVLREQGTHEQLLSLNGIYSKLVHHQLNFQQQEN
ncbi:ABC transporter transmembrane region family protein (macronuclear) [Tetrahymena thermophila SB210]|uniref:ABC transporter transmembrane region family protein n=1 Tax=Tetrahymena thermophila (strain SB210) TaxID=312017 RepID=W7XFH3_TETTS|nr:ABC transporter transmembrane region family protein [Tetrahymena thermophila SB210]EWS76587.1 ABC transporter transmembrane region family protein [Tetrahymena thermophila SB210]|eukprot:XP_012650873.1 ABC transporter transmembrane region family protein [Tetrahymena thermophila SB210]